ncbi:MAG: SH3 domain-containing protein [Anaerolineae bacterium]|jgi:hypothetical protein|nr:SH3 domain-containing protein [Anaerolineae bacterium]
MYKQLLAVLALALIFSAPTQAQTPRQVWAYYFGWWLNESWDDPILTDTPAERYDSRDSGAFGRHIDQAKGAGIDAFILAWFGPNNLTNDSFNALLDQAAARDFKIGVSVDLFQSDYNASIEAVTQTLLYLNDRVQHGAYLRYDGKPVVYFWNQGRFNRAQWQSIRDQVDPARSQIWVMEGTNTAYLGVFDGLYLFNTAWAANPTATAATWATRTRNAGGTFYTPTVLPGWDETNIARRDGRRNPTATRPRNQGDYLTRSWNGAAATGTNVILIVSWNEYYENSHIEPSVTYGTQALDVLRPLIAAWESQTPAPIVGNNGVTSGVEAWTTVNVRQAPNTDSAILGKIAPGTIYEILGQEGGWYRIRFNGAEGFVSAGYVQIR